MEGEAYEKKNCTKDIGVSVEEGILHADLTPRWIQPTTFGEKDGVRTERSQAFSTGSDPISNRTGYALLAVMPSGLGRSLGRRLL